MIKPSRAVWLAHGISLLPFAVVVIDFFTDNLTANPIQSVTLRSGRAATNLLLVSLACSPIYTIMGLSSFLKMRVIFGLYAFAYSLAHFLVFIGWDYGFNIDWVIDEMRTKPFLQIGFIALAILLILAISSLSRVHMWMRNNWGVAQRLVYPAAILIIWHTYLAAKGDTRAAILRGAFFCFLMILRIEPVRKKLVIRVKWIEAINQFLLS